MEQVDKIVWNQDQNAQVTIVNFLKQIFCSNENITKHIQHLNVEYKLEYDSITQRLSYQAIDNEFSGVTFYMDRNTININDEDLDNYFYRDYCFGLVGDSILEFIKC